MLHKDGAVLSLNRIYAHFGMVLSDKTQMKTKRRKSMMKMGDIVWRTRQRHISGHSVVALWKAAVRVESLCCGCLGTVLQLIRARGSIEMSIN